MYSVCLLTATLLTGAVDPPTAGGCSCGAAQPASVTYYETVSGTAGGLRNRLLGRLAGSRRGRMGSEDPLPEHCQHQLSFRRPPLVQGRLSHIRRSSP